MIRTGCYSDAAEMARIFNHYVRTSTVIFSSTELSPAAMDAKLRSLQVGERYPFIVAEDGDTGALLGYAYAHLYQPDPVYRFTLEITIYLAPEACGRGLGGRLLDRLIEECRSCGAHALIATVTAGNAASERMFARAGFRCIGVLPEVGFKFGAFHADALYHRLL